MMYGRGKSDSAIVAEKLVNKAGRLAAESGERRAEAKGCRAQNRESVSQALGRIRKAARQRKKERFPSQLHDISMNLLRRVLRVDGERGARCRRWQDYEADLECGL